MHDLKGCKAGAGNNVHIIFFQPASLHKFLQHMRSRSLKVNCYSGQSLNGARSHPGGYYQSFNVFLFLVVGLAY
ncbi:uncharacterized protein LACBIDRAFT_298659 [Laccaria bicolor S238N-H82]|uniref:Predicted protein n=1 Tax=Laccaria bicolor (strain S238N-H82 / ATCC MYA-4686) TaxID=486041 RepID=B0DDC0_LACBS|nr:uncharacterized protein LACBIDRAFT_298659 [Laccaria bicolor S238N-H82]EDR07589.1 predicted protein [Laccaria bicolor S238N-H82]|eukprot:XP_001881981.1 predicted protein [Laccaria bicolor S238N-H82]